MHLHSLRMSLLWILKPAREERRGRKSGRKGEGEEEEGGMEGGGERVEEGMWVVSYSGVSNVLKCMEKWSGL